MLLRGCCNSTRQRPGYPPLPDCWLTASHAYFAIHPFSPPSRPPLPATLCAGSQLDVPATVTPGQLETLLNGLLQNEEKLPYSFHIEEQVWKRGGGVGVGV